MILTVLGTMEKNKNRFGNTGCCMEHSNLLGISYTHKIQKKQNNYLFIKLITNLFSKYCLLLLILFLSLFILSNTIAQSENDIDSISFSSPSDPNNITNIIFQGEYEIDLNIHFAQNCTNWTVDFSSQLFTNDLRGRTNSNILANTNLSFGLYINNSAPFGTYLLRIYLNYSIDNTNITNYFERNMRLLEVIKINYIFGPTSVRMIAEIGLHTYINLTRIDVNYYAHGDIETIDEIQSIFNVTKGNYTFKTIVKNNNMEDTNSRELIYTIKCCIGRRFSIFRGSIETNIELIPNKPNKNSLDFGLSAIFLIIILILIMILFNYYHFYKRMQENDN